MMLFYRSVCLRQCPERKEETTATLTATRGTQREIFNGECARNSDALKSQEEGAITIELQDLVLSIQEPTMEHCHPLWDATIIGGPTEVAMEDEALTVVEDTQVDEVTQEERPTFQLLKIGRLSTTPVRI
jgi:hypothetical protein